MKRRKRAGALLAILLAALFMPGLSSEVHAQRVTDNISVYVGYTGGPYALKATYSWRDLDDLYGGALPTVQEVYSYYGGDWTAVDSARGIYLTDLLEYAGVDMSSVHSLAFYTDDQTSGAFTSFTKAELLDRPRYYYPNLAANEETGEVYARNGGDVEEGAVQVQPMMALEDNWEKNGIGENFSSLSPSSRFRLLFGQAEPTERRTSQAAKYVNSIYVTFHGVPVFGAESNLDAKVGSDYQVTVNISAADSFLEQYIQENLVWSSNNTDVVEVDLYGNLTVKESGTAEITVSYGDVTETVSITVGGEESLNASLSGDERESGQEVTEVSYAEEDQGVYILSEELMARTEFAQWVNSILEHQVSTDSNEGAVMNWREEDMAADAEQLVLVEEEILTPTALICLSLTGLFLLGMCAGPISYQINMRNVRSILK
ncbi:MAG: Ig-like domain-containing protein [Bacillota bacterium]|nr:Ig-like domain-containing protein [Bacillota bacterium]